MQETIRCQEDEEGQGSADARTNVSCDREANGHAAHFWCSSGRPEADVKGAMPKQTILRPVVVAASFL